MKKKLTKREQEIIRLIFIEIKELYNEDNIIYLFNNKIKVSELDKIENKIIN